MNRTQRDESLLKALATQVQCLTERQVLRGWWPTSYDKGKIRIRRLLKSGLLGKTQVLAADLPELEHPVGSWRPGKPAPNAELISEALNSRWTTDVQGVPVLIASPSLRREYGVGARENHTYLHGSHDLLLSEVFVKLRIRAPKTADRWVGEEVFRRSRRGQKLPDALLLTSNEEVELVIEAAGAYCVTHIEDFHRDCERRGHRYELW